MKLKFLQNLLRIIPFLLLTGCVSYQIENLEKYKKNGTQYGVTRGNFLGRWWDFYERGRSFADGGYYSEAEADIRRALSLRKKDKRRSRTYGLHFIRFFGNRELGAVLYELGRLDEATGYLKKSLEQDPSEKAEYYLNQCLQELSKTLRDSEKPYIDLNPLPTLTNSTTVSIAGVVSDNLFVDTLWVNHKKISPILKKNQFEFQQQATLKPGSNEIKIVATDIFKNRSSISRRIILDLDPPIISILEVTPERILLSVDDENSVELIQQRSKNVDLVRIPQKNVFEFKPLVKGKDVTIAFKDSANNWNGIRIDPHNPRLGSLIQPHDWNSLKQAYPILLASTEILEGILPSEKVGYLKSSAGEKSEPPVLEVQQLDELEIVYQDHVVISGRIHGTFDRFQINGKTKIKQGKDVRFCFRELLELGKTNLLKLKLQSTISGSANTITKSYEIKRMPTPIEESGLRAGVLLFPIAKEVSDRAVPKGAYDHLIHEIFESGRFQILPQKKEEIYQLSRERILITEEWIHPGKAAKLGNELESDYVIACTMRPTSHDVEIFGRLIDTSTGQVLANCDVYESKKGTTDLDSAYKRFAVKLVQNFPLVEDVVTEVVSSWGDFLRKIIGKPRKNQVAIDIGSNANIKKGMKFVAYHHGEPLRDKETGEVILQGKIIIDGKFFAKSVKKRTTYLNPLADTNVGKTRYVVSQ